MSLDKWVEYVPVLPKPPYIDRKSYLKKITSIKVEKKQSVVYIKVSCRNLRKNILKNNWCSLKDVIDPECINCEYVRCSTIIKRRFKRLMKNSFIDFYEYELIEI